MKKIKRALISVSDKENILDLAKVLIDYNVEIISTGARLYVRCFTVIVEVHWLIKQVQRQSVIKRLIDCMLDVAIKMQDLVLYLYKHLK